MRVDLGKVLQDTQPGHAGCKAQTLEMSHCQRREVVKWGVFSISLEGKGCGAHPVSPEVIQRLQPQKRSETECVCVCVSPSPWPHLDNAFPKSSNLLSLQSGMGMFQPLPYSPCPGHISWKAAARSTQGKGRSTRSSRTETATPLEFSLLPFYQHPQGSPAVNG